MIITTGADSSPKLRFRIRRNNRAYNLTGASVSVKIKKPFGTIVTKSPTVIDATGGIIEVSLSSGDLNETNDWYLGEVIVTHADATVQHGRLPFRFYNRAEYTEPDV